jgi:hypothetical protein
MLEKIKLSMRIFHNVLDSAIRDNISACMSDLQRVGVHKDVASDSSQDPLIYKAAELYCKWQDDYNTKGDQYKQAYENLRDALSLCEDYTGGEVSNV